MLYWAIPISASSAITYMHWHFYKKSFLKLRTFFLKRKRVVSAVIPPHFATGATDLYDSNTFYLLEKFNSSFYTIVGNKRLF